ncbi:hypothetical protein B0H19DRAFT_1082786 [Mycena capillaripes]|nr:hypothetical protein B0H19DRAFT_1082786 [Mycena capillaripes]
MNAPFIRGASVLQSATTSNNQLETGQCQCAAAPGKVDVPGNVNGAGEICELKESEIHILRLGFSPAVPKACRQFGVVHVATYKLEVTAVDGCFGTGYTPWKRCERSRTRTPSFTVPPHRKCVAPASLTSPEALAALRELRTTNPALHAALAQEQPPTDDGDDGDDPYPDADVYDDCDIPLEVVSEHLSSGGAGVADNFAVSDDGGITRSGNAEASDAEEEPVVLGRGQRRKIVARRYQGPIWEEH